MSSSETKILSERAAIIPSMANPIVFEETQITSSMQIITKSSETKMISLKPMAIRWSAAIIKQ